MQNQGSPDPIDTVIWFRFTFFERFDRWNEFKKFLRDWLIVEIRTFGRRNDQYFYDLGNGETLLFFSGGMHEHFDHGYTYNIAFYKLALVS